MKKASLISCIIAILVAASSCTKSCYTCTVFVIPAYQIDTFSYYGQMRYDTFGRVEIAQWKFGTCQINPKYHYGNYSQPYPQATNDTIIDCQQNNY